MHRRRLMTVAPAAAIAMAGVLALAPAGAARAAAVTGQPAPAFTGASAAGGSVDLAAFRGKTVVLEWTNHDCPYVRKHYESGNMQATQQSAVGQGVVWLQVISSAPGTQGHVDAATALKLNAQRGASATSVVLDPEGRIGRQYGAKSTPHLFVIRPDGVLAYAGAIDSIPTARKEDIARADNYVKLALADIAAGRPVATANTRAYGCSVKYAD